MIVPNKLKYLVVGTGRCGTVSISRLLTQAGIPCGHEAIFNSEGLEKAFERLQKNTFDQSYTSKRDGWNISVDKIEADASYMAVPFLGSSIVKNTKIIHLVRNPLCVISSFVYGVKHFQKNNVVKEWDNFIEIHLPTIKNFNTPVEKATHFYIEWNKMIKSDFFHRIEDGYPQLLKKLSLEINENTYFDKANHFSRDRSISLKDIPEGNLKKSLLNLSEEYGYNLN